MPHLMRNWIILNEVMWYYEQASDKATVDSDDHGMATDYYLGGNREFIVEISEDGKEFMAIPNEDQKVYKV